MAGEMTLEGLAQEIRTLATQVGGLRQDVDAMRGDMGVMRADMAAGFVRADDSLKREIGAVRADMVAGFARADESLKREIGAVRTDMDARFKEARDHTHLQFEETRRVINLGLEAQEGLRESMDRRFDEAATDRRQRDDLLADIARHLRVRTETLEARPTGEQSDH